MVEAPTEGLRARKKRAARAAIATAARQLFAERGFDAVTVAEVAVAADVSEKTVFNHFATKEDLVFAERDEQVKALVTALRKRAVGVAALDVVRAMTHAMIDEVATAADADAVHLPAIVASSRALQQRLAAGWEDEADTVAGAIGDEDALVAALAARTLLWTHRAVYREALAGLLADEPRKRLTTRLHRQADRAYDQLATGLADYAQPS